MKKLYSIAGLNVEITGDKTLKQVVGLPGFNIFEIDYQKETNIDIHIHLDKDIDITQLTNINKIYYSKILDIKHSFFEHKDGFLYEMYKLDGSKIVSIIYNAESNNVLMSPCCCELSLKYAMWVAYTLSAIKMKVLPMHASSIVKDSGAVLFLGESGTGKSTHTRLWLQYIENSYLLNDDSPLLRIENNEIFIYGSPWSGKTHYYSRESFPLKAIVRLSQFPENRMILPNKLVSIGAIQPSFPPFFAYNEQFSEKIIQTIDKIINEIPVYELKCRPDKQAAETAYAAIY
ncbi:MAG: hypothetical protein E6767_13435 [Dysgonomonas sp.]|nr:hypothetical protein [Dysgonomonas sp.]